jgi:HlyD family secretion protein
MANSKKRKKTLIFGVIGLVLVGLTTAAILKKREVVITVQTEKVERRNLTELVVATGKIQPVLQVKISPEVSGEIIELPVKEGQKVKKGDLILKIKPDFYVASRNQAKASYESSMAARDSAEASLRKAEAEFRRNQDLVRNRLVSDSAFDEVKAAYDVALAQVTNSEHQVEMAKASWASAEDALAKTTIVSPLTGTVSKLNSELGERVVGTATMAGTEVMTIADLNEMEARVDIGEIDVVLIQPGQNARLEVDAFKDRKFNGTVTEIANSSTSVGVGTTSIGGGNQQEATKFGVKIRIQEKETFRPGMSVTAEIETRGRTNVLTVPFASVTTRVPKDKKDKKDGSKSYAKADLLQASASAAETNSSAKTSAPLSANGTNSGKGDKKKEALKPIEVVFVIEGDHVKMAPVKIGISDDTHMEIIEGLTEGQEVVSAGYKAISRELEDGKRIKKGTVLAEGGKEGEQKQAD